MFFHQYFCYSFLSALLSSLNGQTVSESPNENFGTVTVMSQY